MSECTAHRVLVCSFLLPHTCIIHRAKTACSWQGLVLAQHLLGRVLIPVRALKMISANHHGARKCGAGLCPVQSWPCPVWGWAVPGVVFAVPGLGLGCAQCGPGCAQCGPCHTWCSPGRAQCGPCCSWCGWFQPEVTAP